MRLTAVGVHDLLIAPVVAIDKEDRLAELGVLQALPCLGFEALSQSHFRSFALGDLCAEELFHMLAAQDRGHACARTPPNSAVGSSMRSSTTAFLRLNTAQKPASAVAEGGVCASIEYAVDGDAHQ